VMGFRSMRYPPSNVSPSGGGISGTATECRRPLDSGDTETIEIQFESSEPKPKIFLLDVMYCTRIKGTVSRVVYLV
jgi:hypothetical protein